MLNIEELKEYLSLCKFRGDIEDMPESMPLFRQALICYSIIGVFLQINIKGPIEAFFELGIEIILTFLFVAVLLYTVKAMNLYWRVLTAYFVCQDFISIIGVPILMWVTISDEVWSYYILGVVILWVMAVIAYINSQISDFGSFFSAVLSLAYFVSVYGGGFFLLLLFL